MERIQPINTDRIAWSCDQLRVSPEELGERAGISSSTMARVMAGEAGLTFHQLSKIARFIGRGALFLLDEGTPDETIWTPAFRTIANQKPNLSIQVKTLIERAERQRDLFLSLTAGLESEQIRFSPPNLIGMPTKQAAVKVREWLGLRNVNDFDSYRTAVERQGILVFRSNGYSGKWQISKENPILGFSIFHEDCPLIFVKKAKGEARQTFTLMHELWHVLFQRTSSIDDEADLRSNEGNERLANAFAGHLLVPDGFLSLIEDAGRPVDVSQFDAWLEQPKKSWGVSSEVILRRLLDSGRLAPELYGAYKAWCDVHHGSKNEEENGSRKYRYREPKHIFGDRFVRTVFDALDAKQITVTKASGYLDGVKLRDLRALERYYGGP